MKYRNHVSLLLLILLAWIASGCDSRPAKPLPPIPKSQPKVEDQYTPIDREAVEAANQPTADVNQPSSEDIASSGRAANGEPKEAMPVVDKAGGLPWLDADGSQLPMEYWEVQYFNAQRIGITRYRVESDKSGL